MNVILQQRKEQKTLSKKSVQTKKVILWQLN